MTLLVTGANGFLGSYVVAEALRQGHRVRAMVRPATDVSRLPWKDHPAVTLVRVDLRASAGIAEAVRGVDAVLHLAAAKAGDFYSQFQGTVIATENLLRAMTDEAVLRLVAISTFSVYDYLRLSQRSILTEDSPLDADPLKRDEYARTKLIQEQLVRAFGQLQGGKVTILRPGVIYGRDMTWTARLGTDMGHRWIRIGAHAQLPLVYVENCAEAIVRAVGADAAIGQTVNLVDDETPTQRRYIRMLRRRMADPPSVVPINWTLMRIVAATAAGFNRLVLGSRAKLPGVLVPARLHARCKPLRYSNARLKELLGYESHYNTEQALERIFSDMPLPDLPAAAQASRPTTGCHASLPGAPDTQEQQCASPI